MNLTPMMQQYFEIKNQYKDCILFFRLGDFYEMFFEDAIKASKELEITLTGRDCGMEERAPMCGIPFHSAENYISKLIEKGFKVAICEQVEDVNASKGIVKRDVVRVVTPGTVIESSMLNEKVNNYIMAIYNEKNSYGIAIAEITTGEFYAASVLYGNTKSKLIDEISRYNPSELLVNENFLNDKSLYKHVKEKFNSYISIVDKNIINKSDLIERAKNNFKNLIIDDDNTYEYSIISSGILLWYLENTQKVNLDHIKNFKQYKLEEYMIIDYSSRRNLELTETLRDKKRKGSLIGVLDRTKTSMGARLLKKWIEQPLINVSDINERLEAVMEFKEKYMIRNEIRDNLKKVYDIERLMGKFVLGKVNCRDLISFKESLKQLPNIKKIMSECASYLNSSNRENIDTLDDIFFLIEKSIIDEPPITIKEGNIIKDGYNSEVDKYRTASKEGKDWIKEFEKREREATGIKNLKVKYNRIFGYFLEVTKSYFSLIPKNYIRKQTLSNCERFITDDLKKIEETILGAEEKVIKLEYDIFIRIRDSIASQVERVKLTSNSLSKIDVICSFSEVSERENYKCPIVDESGIIKLVNGRHPVVEAFLQEEVFVPNDTTLDLSDNRVAIITGPNMAGKSTYMRQVALITLMAQIGCFVPADDATIGIVDRIFTRVGASDDLSSGQSTFMVEMAEVANILENSTENSLLILDEIGRGTSTFDGLSIAWAVIEYIVNKEKIGARTLFATHYHELSELEDKIKGIKNYCVLVQEKGEDIIFLRKIERGGADDSYGIEVAKLAGVPRSVIDRAKEILNDLEDNDLGKKEIKSKKKNRLIEGQIDLFKLNAEIRDNGSDIIEEIKNKNIEVLTPIEALNYIYDLQKRVKKG
ncbi:MAG: DNA mismatch repair protein MutS [Clostridiales bacterium]